jgi:hypothetical protein
MGIRSGPLGREEGEVSGMAEPAGTHRGGGVTMGRRGRFGAVPCDGVLTEEWVGGDVGELLQHRTWRGGEEQRGNWAENQERQSSPRGHGGGNGGPASSEERLRCGHWRGRAVDGEGVGRHGVRYEGREEGMKRVRQHRAAPLLNSMRKIEEGGVQW